MTALFEVAATDVALTTDEWYTPRWLFKAAGLTFDMDVCAPVDPAYRTCPARRYLTVVEDGLTHPWDGVVWCNPPYSRAAPWAAKFAAHGGGGLALVPAGRECQWLGILLRSADAVALISTDFRRPDGRSVGPGPTALVLAGRGPVAVEALARISLADRYVTGAYHVAPGWSA
jgi:DNA N-6-adenine-methyltransferase (Dam)